MVLGELLANFALASGVLVFVVALGGLVKAMYEFAQVPLGTVLEVAPYLVVGLFPHLLPMAFLVAVVVTYGRMSAEGEIGAIRGAGIHLGRILTPALALACGIAFANQFLLDEGIPTLHFRRGEFLKKAAQAAVAGWNRGVPDIHIGPFYLRGTPAERPGLRRDVVLVVGRDVARARKEGGSNGTASSRAAAEAGSEALTVHARADEAQLSVDGDFLVVELRRPRFVRAREVGEPPAFLGMDEGTASFRISLLDLTSSKTQELKERDLPTSELLAALERGRLLPQREHHARYEVERRSALALAPVLFTLVGVPFGVFFRRGNRLFGFFLAFGIVLVAYYPILVLCEHLADARVLDPVTAAYVGDAVLLLVGGAATARLFRA
jgi:lipopolysaccharide export LptBFGC system permease protein LptF